MQVEGSGPTMAKDLPEYIKLVKEKNLNVLYTVMELGLMENLWNKLLMQV